jgi:hypothetical protein
LFVIPAKPEALTQKHALPTAGERAAQSPPKWFGFDLASQLRLELVERGVSVDALCVKSGGGHWSCGDGFTRGPITLVPKVSVATVTRPSQRIATTTAHLFNFPDFDGPDSYVLRSGGSMTLCGRSVLRADGWRITIAATDKTKGLCQALDDAGGYVITHVVEVTREDGATYTSDDLEKILSCLQVFLGFAMGRPAGVALPVGFDGAGQRVFEQWGLPTTAPNGWGGSLTWFDAQHAGLLSEVFPGFYAIWGDQTWSEAIWKAIYWYLQANGRSSAGRSVEGGLILAQAALELLAWTRCVQHKKMVSPDGFERAKASDKLRFLATSLDIPLEIPRCLGALRAGLGKKCSDAMHAITDVRNDVVHPKSRHALNNMARFEAWNLSLWYIEMAILRLCGHTGSHANRLKMPHCSGTVEPVPWVRK